MTRWRCDRGALSVEFVALLPLLLLVALAALQTLTVVAAGTSTTNAARDGSRAHAVPGVSCPQAVHDSLPTWLRDGHTHTCGSGSETVVVRAQVPNLFPGISWPNLAVTREATLPDTSN